MKYKFFFPWSIPDISYDFLNEYIENNPNTKIVIFNPEELDIYQAWYDEKHKIDKVLDKNKSIIEYWLLGLDKKDFTTGLKNITQVRWPLIDIFYTISQSNITQKVDNIDKLFVFLNNKSHPERCWLIDELSKEGLLNHGYISWLKNETSLYHFKYYDNQQRILDSSSFQRGNIFPKQYYKGLFNIISESVDYADISEKTYGAILNKKPFLIQGSRYIHQYLRSLGFQLFEELFDYDFDQYSTYKKRSRLITTQLHQYRNADYNQLYQRILPKIEYNYNHLMQLSKDKNSVPSLFRYYYENHHQEYFNKSEYKMAYEVSKLQ